jgi:multidrug efflux system membrane fusion protein
MTIKKVLRGVLPVLIILLGLAGTRALMKLKPKPEKQERAEQVTSVEVIEAQRSEQVARIYATGVVEPARQVTLSPEVSGRVTFVGANVVPGGRVKSGQTIIRVDSRDYELGVDQMAAQVEQAKLNLELELSQQDVRKKEYKLLGNKDVKISPLALREPQVKTAEVAVKSAESGLRRSELALERTTLRAPFNAMVINEQVEIGQVAAPGAPVATLIGTDRFWITTQVPVERLAYMQLSTDGGEGSEVTIIQDLGTEGQLVRKGRALRLKGGLDPATRTAQVVVGVDNPLDPPPGAVGNDALPLLPGAFVNVEIDGKKIEDTMVIPRIAMIEGDRVWTVDDDNRLRKAQVSIAWRSDTALYIKDGLAEGTRVVTSPIALPLEGMRVEITRTGKVAKVGG